MSLKDVYLSLQELTRLVQENNLHQKEHLSFQETLIVFGFKKDYLYGLTSDGLIPHYKPTPKLLRFRKSEVENWIIQNRIKPVYEIQGEVNGTVKEAVKHGK